ncbi:unnamed protein product [Adineta steineri]|uniref:ETS domain-containing protein n=1 Tax=Adineta steineri TaxID=433720 RepID=A0A813T733_9BILA|nr:unnamed protein product [Adineta steineri]CAF3828837.1 unnamed protein product [Adineta steineri]
MMNEHHEEKNTILPKLEEFSPVFEIYEDQSSQVTSNDECDNSNEDISDNDTKQSLPLLTHSNDEIQEQSDDDFNEIPFDAKEWFVHDSTAGKLRPPRQNEFLYKLLEDSRYSSHISWLDRNEGLFKIHDPNRVAELWIKVKSRQTSATMDYDTFSRGIRYYYKTGAMIKTHKKYTFRFKKPVNSIV